MRLKDKQSGEVNDYTFSQKVGEKSMIGLNLNGDLDHPIFFNSLRELCERFEDAPKDKPFEEVEKVAKKLKAWEHLQGYGFEFTGWREDECSGDIIITAHQLLTGCTRPQLDILFGAKDEKNNR